MEAEAKWKGGLKGEVHAETGPEELLGPIEIADLQEGEFLSKPAQQLPNPDPFPLLAWDDSQIKIGIDGEIAHLDHVQLSCPHQIHQALHFPLLVGHTGKDQEIEGNEDPPVFGSSDGFHHLKEAVASGSEVGVIEKRVGGIQADSH